MRNFADVSIKMEEVVDEHLQLRQQDDKYEKSMIRPIRPNLGTFFNADNLYEYERTQCKS